MLGFSRWQLFKGLALAVGIVGVVSLALAYFIPAPPSTVTMATGFKGASVEYYGRRYREIFARSHVQLELRETDGAVENIQLLQDPCRSGRIDGLLMQVQIAVEGLQFVQKLYQVLETATKPVNGPRRDHVDTPRCGVLQQPVQAGALFPPVRTGNAGVLIEVHHFPA